MNLITKTTRLSVKIMEEYISHGDLVIDATAGNGNDTLALAKLAGKGGKVLAFDIQQEALKKTESLLKEEGFFDVCRLILDSHHNMGNYLAEEEKGGVSAIVFNLGYLPRANKELTTKVQTTLPAVEKSLEFIKPNGIVVLIVYSGHEEGMHEKEALLSFASQLSEKKYHTAYLSYPNQKKNPPELLLITKK